MAGNKAPRKRKPPKNSKGRRKNEVLNDLRSLRVGCQNLLKESASIFPLLRNKELVEAGDIEKITNLSNILARDLEQMKSKLEEINASVPEISDPNDLDAIFPLLDVGERYQNWQGEYISAVVPTVQQLNELLEAARQNLEGKDNG